MAKSRTALALALVVLVSVAAAQRGSAESVMCIYNPIETPSARGIILDPTGHPVAKATVDLWHDGWMVATTTTASDGQFDLDVTKPGEYQIIVSVSGFLAYLTPLWRDYWTITDGESSFDFDVAQSGDQRLPVGGFPVRLIGPANARKQELQLRLGTQPCGGEARLTTEPLRRK